MDRNELLGNMTQQTLHVEYRRAWRQLFAELLSWTPANVEAWEASRFGSLEPGKDQLSVIQHYGIEHYVAEVLLPRDRLSDWSEGHNQALFSKARGLLSLPVNNYFLNKPTFTNQVLADLDAVLKEAGMSISECSRRQLPKLH